MDSGRTTVYSGGLKLSADQAIERSGYLGTHRSLANIRWYEYMFFTLGTLAALITDGLTIARLVKIGGSLSNPEFAYGILILVHSVFLLLFLFTGLLYQRITDIIAFFVSAVLLTIYVVVHYFYRKGQTSQAQDTQPEIRLARLIITIVFNICFIPLSIVVIKDYKRDEFSQRLFGAFTEQRRPLRIYSTFDCVMRLSTMLSISSLLLNLYNYTGYQVADTIFLSIGIPVVFIWLGVGIGMARLESFILMCIFYFLSLFQLGFLGYCLSTTIIRSIDVSKQTPTTTIATSTLSSTTTVKPPADLLPIFGVLYVCISANLLAHITSIIFGFWCTRQFGKGLQDKLFNSKIDKWIRERF
ncbi:unnamed protein product [Adineta ricciae]|uniref:DUF7789 domain-containing protein n=1 Tax=Adineta ricciae TaxID=249248 RepID=A0A815ZIQ7_ADIRI|nr:unnamed protein product [Adineta ricciae]CAF1584647.1 unnamed protein product [Adineta ricciae]